MRLLYSFPDRIVPGAGGAATLDWGGRDPFSPAAEFRPNDAISFPRVRPGAFSAAECDAVIALGEARARRAATVDGRDDLSSRDYRVSSIAWIEPDPDAHWLFHRLAMLFADANADYRFDLAGFAEGLQYTSYGQGQYFNWHCDVGPGETALRKLSLTIQLSAPEDYTGGALEFHGAVDMPVARTRGCATFFPSYLAHQVAPITAGLRRSLVAWAYGPAFR